MSKPSPVVIHTVPALTDNYCYLVHREGSSRCLVVDTSEAAPIRACLNKRKLDLNLVLNTHHHWDHVAANTELAEGLNVYCSEFDEKRVPLATRGLKDEEKFDFDGIQIEALTIPGHTQGQLGYHIPSATAVFVGDTLFSMGCGRLLEGSPEQMLLSLERLTQLPPATRIYFGHEYTEKNAEFARSVEPDNDAIKIRLSRTREALARDGFAEAPSLEEELTVNPFLRLSSATIRSSLKLSEATDLKVFTELRARRNVF